MLNRCHKLALLTVVSIGALSGCGGGSSETQSTPTKIQPHSSQSSSSIGTTAGTDLSSSSSLSSAVSALTDSATVAELLLDADLSTSLSENTLIDPDDLNVYETIQIHIPTQSLTMDGQKRFAKVSSAMGQTLFLGQIPSQMDFNFPLHVELAAFPLSVEVFSESIRDTSTIFEVSYDH